ncbi:MAG: type II secretion system minor pseudopilin GspH [Gammaproteobacteria bacterium]
MLPIKFNKQTAFTLIELLVVIVIIGIITATTLFTTAGVGKSRRVLATASQIQEAISLAQTQAILTSSVLGFQMTNTGYYFYIFSTQKDSAAKRLHPAWITITDSTTLSPHAIASFIKVSMSVNDSPYKTLQANIATSNKNKPQILILPSGGFTPFTLIISDNHGKTAYSIKGNMAGNLVLKPYIRINN